MAPEETAPLTSLMSRSHSQDGTSPVRVPRTTSEATPSIITLFLPYLSTKPPILGDSTAKAIMKLLVKTPTEATLAPRLNT